MTLPEPYYDDGQITIYCGNALDILPQIENIGGLITDPPYSSGGQFRGDRMNSTTAKYVYSNTAAYRPEFAGDTRDQRGFFAWATLWLTAALSNTKTSGHVCIFTDWRQLPTVTDAIQAAGWVWRGLATWHKPGIRMQRGGFSYSAEYVVWGTAGACDREHDYSPQNVFKCAPVGGDDKLHIAQKPEPVMRWLAQLVPSGKLIVDPFMGSGTTLRVARDLGRRAIGIEIEERYCEVAVKRLQQSVLPLEVAQ